MKIKKGHFILIPVLLLSSLIYVACGPLKEFDRIPVYAGTTKSVNKLPAFDKSKKTIVIVANNSGTEIFDAMAPYYLFNATGKANVYLVAEKQSPVTLLKGVFAYPNLTFAQMDSLKITPDVIVIPAMVGVFKDAKSPVIKWIKEKHNKDTKILSVCVGSLVGAATGLYDGKPMTTHASDFEQSQQLFKNPQWVQDVSVTHSTNLYSTAGVSNAVEGSLMIINEMFGRETMQKIMQDIHYPHNEIMTEHKSLAVKFGNKLTIAKKLIFRKNRKIGVPLQDGIDEFSLAAILDTYHRTFPASCDTFTATGNSVTSKYGLTFMPTNTSNRFDVDELYILKSENFSKSDSELFKDTDLIRYDPAKHQYIIDNCLDRIKEQYGSNFQNITKLLLDYN